jgi:hypothetical protein
MSMRFGGPKSQCQSAFRVLLTVGVFALASMWSSAVAAQTSFYVRAGATGSGSGTDWQNAYTALPSALVRGATYYVASGTYPSHTFKDPVDGTKYITIKKATVEQHGSDNGWSNTYAVGAALWTPTLKFASSFYIFDGVTGGGPGEWTTGHGFKLSSPDDVMFVMLSDKWADASGRVNVDHVVISHVEIEGRTPAAPGVARAFDATAFGAKFDAITISHCYIHDIGGVVSYWFNSTNVVLEYNYFTRNASSPEHHGSMILLDGTSGRWKIRWNQFSDIVGSGWIGSYSDDFVGAAVDSVDIFRNVFFYTDGFAGLYGNGVIYTTLSAGATNWRVNNNSFVNLPTGLLVNLYNGGSNTAYNNLFYRIGGAPTFQKVTHDYSWFGEPAGVYGELHSEPDGGGDPFVAWRSQDFRLRRNSSPGLALAPEYGRDMLGDVATLEWRRGALQAPGVIPPTELRIVP